MNTKYNLVFLFFLLIFVVSLAQTDAATYIVKFGGALGESYSPNTLSVNVGDIIQWQGDFSQHPLSSTSIPAGAQSFHMSAGSVFSYTVAVAGTYLYQCDFHAGAGMTGSFTVSQATGIQTDLSAGIPELFKLEQNYPNPFNPSTKIKYSLPSNEFVTLKIYDMLGREIMTVVNEEKPAGSYEVSFDAKYLSSGVYLYKIAAGDFKQSKKMILMK